MAVEGRNALIGRGEGVFFWIAWRQASRMWLWAKQSWRRTKSATTCTFVGACLHSLDMPRIILIHVLYPNCASKLPQMCKLWRGGWRAALAVEGEGLLTRPSDASSMLHFPVATAPLLGAQLSLMHQERLPTGVWSPGPRHPPVCPPPRQAIIAPQMVASCAAASPCFRAVDSCNSS